MRSTIDELSGDDGDVLALDDLEVADSQGGVSDIDEVNHDVFLLGYPWWSLCCSPPRLQGGALNVNLVEGDVTPGWGVGYAVFNQN